MAYVTHLTDFGEPGPLHLPHLDVNPTTALPHSLPKKLKLARQEDISCLNSLGISNFRENLPSLPDGLASLSFWVDYGGSGLGQVDMSGGQMALPGWSQKTVVNPSRGLLQSNLLPPPPPLTDSSFPNAEGHLT